MTFPARYVALIITYMLKELAMLDLSFRDIPDFISAVRWKFCDPKYALQLENLGASIRQSCPYSNVDIAIFHDAQLSW